MLKTIATLFLVTFSSVAIARPVSSDVVVPSSGDYIIVAGTVLKVINANKVEIKFTKPDKSVVTRPADLINHKMIVGEKINVIVTKTSNGQYVFVSIAKDTGTRVTVVGAVLKVINANNVEIKFTKPDKSVVTRPADLTNHKMIVGEKINVVLTKTSNGQYVFVSISKKASPPPSPPPPSLEIPSWVQGNPQDSPTDHVRESGKWNADTVRAANKAGKKLDFVLYGDSITAYVKAKGHMGVFEKYFGKSSAPLGVGGNTVQNLAWRLVNTERLSSPPKTVVVLIGINNIRGEKSDPVPYMDQFLIPYLKSVYPSSKIIMAGLLPSTGREGISATTAKANQGYKKISAKYGVKYVDISSGLYADNPNQFFDGLHPTGAGYDILFRNLKSKI